MDDINDRKIIKTQYEKNETNQVLYEPTNEDLELLYGTQEWA